MKRRADMRRALDELTHEITRAGIGAVPLVAGMRCVGEDGETRSPGLYREGRTAVVVFDGEFPDETTLRSFFRGADQLPLLIGGEADPALLVRDNVMARNRLRHELDQLASEVERLGVAHVPLVVNVDERELDERDDGDTDAFLRRKFPRGFPPGSHTPLVVILGPDYVEPPGDVPFE